MKPQGAGFVLYRKLNGTWHVLVLVDNKGKFDFPKGHVDAGDMGPFATAQRECFEETGIFVKKDDLLCKDSRTSGPLTMFCASTSQDPSIGINPVTGNKEHIGCFWAKPESAVRLMPKYLKKVLSWSIALPVFDT